MGGVKRKEVDNGRIGVLGRAKKNIVGGVGALGCAEKKHSWTVVECGCREGRDKRWERKDVRWEG